MSETIEWEKPSGARVITNAETATIKAAVDLGWEQVIKEPVPKPVLVLKPVKKTSK